MAYNKEIVEKLSRFNNLSFTKKQWDIILTGCGCPKSSYFWKALKEHNIQKANKLFTLIDVNSESFAEVWANYSSTNKAAVKKSLYKKEVLKKLKEKKLVAFTLYLVDGCLTTDKPTRD